MNNCGLTAISTEVFANTPEVNEYDFTQNSLGSLDMRGHTSVGNLQTFRAQQNRLTTIEGLDRFYNLKTLILGGNQLSNSVVDMVNTL